MIDGKKLVNYLAHGIAHNEIASALGLSISRVSQLAEDEKVVLAVNRKKKEIETKNVTELADLNAIKRSLISKLGDLVDGAETLGEVTRSLTDVNKLIAQQAGVEDGSSSLNAIIMQVPVFISGAAANAVQFDSAKRIIAIGDKNMAPMPTQGVMKLLKEHNSDSTDILKEVEQQIS